HLLFDEQAAEIFENVDQLAERVRRLGAITIHSVGEVANQKTLADNDKAFVAPQDMLGELMADNKQMAKAMREVHEICDNHNDVATASVLETLIDLTEKRTWFLFEASRKG
ncbi:MAG: Dps family protein, partial [Rhizomicrobium sp.]